MEFDVQEIQNIFPNYKVQDQLGAGATGKVYLLIQRTTNHKVALKKINCFGMTQYQKNNAINQVRLLCSLNNPRIIQMESCLIDNEEENIYILMQCAENGDVSELINQYKQIRKRIPESIIWKIVSQIAQGLMYLHSNKIIHRDVKPANILKFANSYKLADMNVSKIMKNSILISKIGTPYYNSPQIWQTDGYNEKCDIWSLGVVAYELCCLKLPFEAANIQQLIQKLKSGKISKIPTCYSYIIQELIMKMLIRNPNERISAEQVIQICIKNGKMKDEKSLEKSKVSQILMDTIVFPQTNQKWINLLPLPPKSLRKQSIGHTASIKQPQNDPLIDNISVVQNKSCIFIPNNKNRKQNKSEDNKQKEKNKIRLPSILKKGPIQQDQNNNDNKGQILSRLPKSFRRITSSRKNRNLFQQCLKQAKKRSNNRLTTNED